MNRLVRNTGIKAIAILLIITVIATLLPARMNIWCEGDTAPKTAPLAYDQNECPLFLTEEKTTMCSLQQIPEVMGDDESLLKKPIPRLDSEGDPLNIIRYLESWDLERTIIFPVDVKYVDSFGIVRDKSNKLYTSQRQGIAYETQDNDILSYFSDKVLNGVETTFGDYTITIWPESRFNSNVELLDDNSVIYKNTFEEGIDLKVSPTFNGNKTDIILNNKPESNSFKFNVIMPGCTLSFKDRAVSFIDGETEICSFTEIYIKDSVGNITFGDIKVVGDNTIEIEVPVDFLDSNNTIYPLVVDPVLYFVTNHVYDGDNINTAQLNSFFCGVGGNITKSSVMFFGQTGTASFEHPIMRFPNLYAVIQNMSNIEGAYLTLYRESTYTGVTNTTITAKPITMPWTERYYSASEYNTLFYATSTNFNASCTLKAGASASGLNFFTITNLVNYWRQGNWVNGNGVNGISFDIGNYAYPAAFHGGLTSTSSKMPQISISHSYTATGQIQDGIYFISPTSSFSGGDTDFCLTRTIVGNTTKATSSLMSDCCTQNYPLSDSNYISYMRDLNQLYKIEYTNVGYRIKCIKKGQYLAFLNSSTLCFVNYDDNINYTTRWSFVKVNNKYYIVSYFGHFLSVPTTSYSCDVGVNLYYNNDGVLWNLQLYCLDVELYYQQVSNTCGPACIRMVLSYFGIDVSNYTDNQLKSIGLGLLPGYQYGTGHIKLTIRDFWTYQNLNYYLHISISPANLQTYTQQCFDCINDFGMPPVALLHPVASVGAFTYTVDGHFVVICGTYYDKINSNYRVVYLDPYTNPALPGVGYNHNVYGDMPMSDFYNLVSYISSSALVY